MFQSQVCLGTHRAFYACCPLSFRELLEPLNDIQAARPVVFAASGFLADVTWHVKSQGASASARRSRKDKRESVGRQHQKGGSWDGILTARVGFISCLYSVFQTSYFSHSLYAFCFCLVFQPSLPLMLFTQSSLRRP